MASVLARRLAWTGRFWTGSLFPMDDKSANSPEANYNPYAPPAANSPPVVLQTGSDYSAHVQPVLAVLGLTAVTCGIYYSVWYIRRKRLFDSCHASEQVGNWPTLALIFQVVTFPLVFVEEAAPIANLVSLAGGLLTLILTFRCAAILRSDFAESGRDIPISSIWVFFFGAYYLQYKINRAAEMSTAAADAQVA